MFLEVLPRLLDKVDVCIAALDARPGRDDEACTRRGDDFLRIREARVVLDGPAVF